MANDRLAFHAVRGTLLMLISVGAVLALSSGTLGWPEGWAFLATYSLCVMAMIAYLLRVDPALVERRMHSGPAAEREPRQKLIQTVTMGTFLAQLVVPGLDHRYGWSHMPLAVICLGHALIIAGFAGILRVFRENAFASSIIEVGAGQRVIDTGPYAIVRHPMYAVALPGIFAGIPLALGSWWALALVVPITVAIVARLLDEERFLTANLPGYADYCRRLRWRLVPGVW